MAKLWLDDERDPPNEEWDVVGNYQEFVDYIDKNGVPELISFDHDLGDPANGYYCAVYIVQNRLPLKSYNVHSSNPVGAKNIKSLLDGYDKSVEKEIGI